MKNYQFYQIMAMLSLICAAATDDALFGMAAAVCTVIYAARSLFVKEDTK